MAQIGDLTVKIGIEGANKAVQDLEKVRRQLELISNLARNTAASFATFNTQLRQFSNATNQMSTGFNQGAQSATRFNYGIQNTARILKDINAGNLSKSILDTAQTLSIVGPKVSAGLRNMFGITGTTVGGTAVFGASKLPPTIFGKRAADFAQTLARYPLYNFQQSDIGKIIMNTPYGQNMEKVIMGRGGAEGFSVGPNVLPPFLTNYIKAAGANFSWNGPLGVLGTPMFGAGKFGLGPGAAGLGRMGFLGGGFGSIAGVGAISGAAGLFVGVINMLKSYMIMLGNATLRASSAISGFVANAVQTAAGFQSLRSQNISGIIGSQFGGVYNATTAARARGISAQQFSYMREIAKASVYTLPDIAGAANILTTAGIPLNRFLKTTALTGQASGLRGREVELVARMFSRLAFGDFPDPEVGARFGLVRSNPELLRMGMKFDKSGQMMTGSADAVNIVERFLNKRFGSGFLVAAMDFNTKFASLADQYQENLEKFATPIMNSLIPAMDAIGKTMTEFSDKGIFTNIGAAFSTFIDDLTTYLSSPDFRRHAAMFIAVIEEIPKQLSGLLRFFTKMLNHIIGALQSLNKNPLLFIADFAGDVLVPGKLAGKLGAQAGKNLASPNIQQNNVLGMFQGLLGEQISAPFTVFDRFQAINNMLNSPFTKKNKPSGLGREDFAGENIKKSSEETAKNTKQLLDVAKKTFDIFDMRRQTIGLGPLGRLGVTGAEFASMGLPFTESRGISIGPITGYNLRHPGSISPGPVRGTTMMERGVRAITRESGTAGRTNRGIRTSR